MSHDKQFKSFARIEQKEVSGSSGEGILKISGWASKSYENGKPIVDRDGEHLDNRGNVDLSNVKILLNQHQWDEPIGKVKVTNKPEGLWIEAELYEALDKKTFFAVKNGVLDSFSIGFTVKDYRVIKVDGEDIISFTDVALLEVSIVSIPAVTQATIQNIQTIKSFSKDGQCTGLQCSIKALKAMNPDCECLDSVENKGKEMNDEINEKSNIKNIIKGLTFEETENERWSQDRKLSYYIGVLIDTIHDNFYESMWQDDMSPEDYKQNIINTLTTFAEKLDEFSVLDKPTNVDVTKNQRENENMKIKSVEESTQENQAETLEGQEEETPAIVDETPEQEKESEPVETSEENIEVTETPSDNATEENPVEESNLQPKPISTNEIIGALSTISLDKLSEEEIEALYDTASAQMEKIEAYVRQVLAQGDGEE